MKISVPYYKSEQTAEIPDNELIAVLRAKGAGGSGEAPEALVRASLENPIGSPRLCELAKSVDDALIICSDHTRPVPSKILMPLMLEEIRRFNPEIKVTLLIATGCHRPATREELIYKFGEKIVAEETIAMHLCGSDDEMKYCGTLPSGGELWVNKRVCDASLVVAEGFIEPHFFAGFSGGRKSVLPGVVSKKTVYANHCAHFIADSASRTGILENNPMHKDMVFAAKKAALRFILNVALDDKKQIIASFAGDMEKAHEAGCAFVKEHAAVKRTMADIVITSNGGYPLDQNIYQAVKSMTAAEECVNAGGVIIVCSSCSDGHGGEAFYRYFKDNTNAEEIWSKILAVPQQNTCADQWQAQILARVMRRASVILVSDMCDHQIIRDMMLTPASSLQEAILLAKTIKPQGKFVIIPDGVSVIVA